MLQIVSRFTLHRICGLRCEDNNTFGSISYKYFSSPPFILGYNISFVCLRQCMFNYLYFLQSNKAFKRIDIDKKKEEIDKLKTKYGINSEEKK
jgi:hypothetical protein